MLSKQSFQIWQRWWEGLYDLLSLLWCCFYTKSARGFLLIGLWMEVVQFSSTFTTKSLYCRLPVSSKAHRESATNLSTYLRLSSTTSFGKSSKKGWFPILSIVQNRALTCFWNAFCVVSPAHNSGVVWIVIRKEIILKLPLDHQIHCLHCLLSFSVPLPTYGIVIL